MRVFLVGNDPSLLRAIARALRIPGVDTLSFASPADAIREMASQPPDTVVCDNTLVDTTGGAVLQEVAALLPETRRVLLSANADILTVEQRGGATHLVSKPWSTADLLAAIGVVRRP
jgi:ActR/RegA family two-component response regulator